MTAQFRFAAVGDNCTDRLGLPIGRSLVGGNALNVAVQLARLGNRSFYFGAVGRDAVGERTRAELEANRVVVDHLRVGDRNTAWTDIKVLPSGERLIAAEDFGACAGYAPHEAELAILEAMDHVHIGWLDDGGALRRRLSRAGVSVSQDISVNADPANLGVEGLSIAFCSTGEPYGAAAAMAADLLSRGAGCAVVMRGAEGSMAFTARERAETGIRPVEVVDTTGAGDSFIAGFLHAWLAKKPLLQCLESGRDRAALTCCHLGGFPQEGMPH
ncbi:MAG: fructoselysine 6-kinase [Mesorhizobium sp.]|uniref:PfkB family carbohydrate kinase n=1 Tax=unclassified Mesorhizobium TaxID=325217 RepID=UPI000FCA75F2|nr:MULTISPECIES: PfkB family carbohydrate kinase [unclassified Mesorhizobium]RUV43595.1 fructoselysine 6-kinase [Mesorhizobium sp. M1A.T.Ca.IN.004.03.1.1]RWG19489.1 MAG: fructoselysine 6-kinase [Mesorhizobium sp.]RWI90391.1 MAG: fructoselysine 6-kinase [Mesorhizobium sp.]RWK33489.1 MAG: fructoselysine 6-kinase [Mesorhizobium sp.]RWK87012.1 MAG: fructoselysine 6-kinase [Mesorhizobium sp.]